MKVELVPTTNLVLNWASARSEAHNLDKNLSTITVRSKDGFPFNLDVAQIIHVPTTEAPKVIARFGNMVNLLMKDNLQIAYFTTGQRVPEDIEIATPAKLADMIFHEGAE